jgi:hypothetical protein
MSSPEFLQTLEAALVRVFAQLTDEEREAVGKKIEQLYQQHRRNLAAAVAERGKILEGGRRPV